MMRRLLLVALSCLFFAGSSLVLPSAALARKHHHKHKTKHRHRAHHKHRAR
jgi:hypothetical protein